MAAERYSGVWSQRSDVESSFGIRLQPHEEILFAHYSSYHDDDYDYEMWARVLFVDRSVSPAQLYEVHASHCSCYGLEDQWEPEKVSISDVLADLKMGRTWGRLGDRLAAVLAELANEVKR